MPYLDSSWWDTKTGGCVKHLLPEIPCPQCISGEGDEDLEIVVTEQDRLILDFDENISLADLVPKNLADRVRKGTIGIR